MLGTLAWFLAASIGSIDFAGSVARGARDPALDHAEFVDLHMRFRIPPTYGTTRSFDVWFMAW